MENQERVSLGRLLASLHWQARSYFDKELEQFGLSSGTLPVIIRLLRRDSLNQQKLSERLYVDKATITRMVGKLVKQGYVRREQDPEDKRAYRLFATQRAREIEPKIKQILRKWMFILVEGFSDEEKELAIDLLKRMHDNALHYREQ
jgi:DNA-binding MarR family transcriptional regulator